MVEILLIAIALAIDCFTVSIAAGVTARRIIWKPMIIMTLAFGIFQGGMTVIGYFGMDLLAHWIETFDHWLAFILLLYLGFNMISTIWNKEESTNMDLLALHNIPTLAVATSIDALAVGISFACVGFQWSYVVIIALISSLATIIGLGIGIKAGQRIPFPVEPLGGIVLIGIGVKILIEHLS